MKIFKEEVEVRDGYYSTRIRLADGEKVIAVGHQPKITGDLTTCVWFTRTPEGEDMVYPPNEVVIIPFMTGEDIPDGYVEHYLGTVLYRGGSFVLHFFAVPA